MLPGQDTNVGTGLGLKRLRAHPVRAHCGQQISPSIFREERADMTVATTVLSHRLRPLMAAICLSASLCMGPALGLGTILATSAPAQARGPDGIADVAEKGIDAVVKISTSP